jgi:hypothetical protein
MKTLIKLILLFGATTLMAQKADSTNTKKDTVKQNPSYFDKYKQKSVVQKNSNEPNLNLPKTENKKVESNYKVENNRVTGGTTTLKIGDKSKKKN